MNNRLGYKLYDKYGRCIINGMRYTIEQFNEEFPNEDVCLDHVFQERYGDVKTCPSCNEDTKFYRVNGRKCYACMHCGYQLHPLAETIFHKSSTSLKSWFYAIYLFSVSKNGVAAKELERHLGVTYKTAYRMAAQIRKLMYQESEMLGGTVEVDEAFIGGKHKRSAGYEGKSAILGMVERDGKMKAKHVRSTGTRVLVPEIAQSIAKGTDIMSDKNPSYYRLKNMGYSHTTVNHSKLQYVLENTHTNTIEGFWGQLKRSLDGTFHAVSPKHLQAYVDEFVYRYNLRGKVVYPFLLERAVKRVGLAS